MIRTIDYHGLKAVEFSKGDYVAVVVPEVGANLIRLANTRLGIEILHTPSAEEVENFRTRPQIYGLPLLFPPNRIRDGRYTFEGRTYQYPITIAKENNYHHGIIKGEPFQVSKAREDDEEVVIECRYYSNAAADAIYRDFPHAFKCKMIYKLSSKGLKHEVVFSNRSDENMPVGVGYHTPIMMPFEGGAPEEYRMRAAVSERVELDGRNLPTGRLLPLGEFAQLRDGGMQMTGCPAVEAGFTLREIEVDGENFRGAVAEHLTTGHKVYYEVDDRTCYWTIWNNGGDKPYCCPEPQSWITDAPNAADPEAAGFRWIAPGKKFSMKFRLYAR